MSAGYYVYVARRHSDLAVKIGYSADPCERVQMISYAHPCVLRAVFYVPTKGAAREVEFQAHGVLSKLALGGEWFRATIEDARSVVASLVGGEQPFYSGRTPHARRHRSFSLSEGHPQ